MDADLVFDVRFLPNPYYDPALRNLTGLDKEVFDYVMNHKESEEFYNHLTQLIKPILPGYKKEGKSVLTIAVGCTGGQHRSVAFCTSSGPGFKKMIGQSMKHIVIRIDVRRQ